MQTNQNSPHQLIDKLGEFLETSSLVIGVFQTFFKFYADLESESAGDQEWKSESSENKRSEKIEIRYSDFEFIFDWLLFAS